MPMPDAKDPSAARQTMTPERFRRIASIALAFLYLIVITGATVRLTGSGLGCPDWPSCSGVRPVPQLEYHGLIEFGNRLISFPTLVFSIAVVWAARRLATRRDLRISAGLTLAGVLLQIVLGGLTVRLDLHPATVAVHFLVSIAILAVATYGVAAVGQRPTGPSRAWVPFAALLAACAVVIVTGVLTTAAGPHSGGEAVARVGNFEDAVQVHWWAVMTFAAATVAIATAYRRVAHIRRSLVALVILVAVQIAIGEIQYYTELPWGLVLAHVATAAAIWITTCWISVSALGATARAR